MTLDKKNDLDHLRRVLPPRRIGWETVRIFKDDLLPARIVKHCLAKEKVAGVELQRPNPVSRSQNQPVWGWVFVVFACLMIDISALPR